MSNQEIQCAVYLTRDLMRLLNAGINEIPVLVKNGTLPPPLANPGKHQKRRWSKAAVNKKLGIQPSDEIRALVRQAVAEELGRSGNKSALA